MAENECTWGCTQSDDCWGCSLDWDIIPEPSDFGIRLTNGQMPDEDEMLMDCNGCDVFENGDQFEDNSPCETCQKNK